MSEECPRCGKRNNGATDVQGRDLRPSEGDASICVYCGALSVFTGHRLDKRLPSQEETAALLTHPAIRSALVTIRATKRMMN